MNQVQVKVAQHVFALDAEEVERQVRDVMPEPLADHYVVVGGRRFPPKQVIGLVTGLDRADFNTHQARRILARLGFAVGRRLPVNLPPPSQDRRNWPHGGREADLLRPYMGKWVAQKGLEVLVSADTPEAIIEWLYRHNIKADGMFRVPTSEREAEGAGPF